MTVQKLRGLAAKFRPKLRDKVLTFTMTAIGHKALRKLLRERPLSRSDLLEELVRKEAGESTEG